MEILDKITEYEMMLDEILSMRGQNSDDFTARRLANLMTIIEKENGGLTQVVKKRDNITDVYLKIREERDYYLFDLYEDEI